MNIPKMDIYRILLAAWFVCFQSLILVHTQSTKTLRIGGIFRGSDIERTDAEKVFRFAIKSMNGNHRALSGTHLLAPEIRYLNHGDTYDAMKKCCGLLHNGIVTLFGPRSEGASASVQGVCESMDVPHVKTIWDRKDTIPPDGTVTLNLYPLNKYIGMVLQNLVVNYGWQSEGVTILYEEYEGLVRLQEVIQLEVKTLRIIQIDENYKSQIKGVKISGISHVIIDCGPETAQKLLEEMLKLQMLKSYFHYIFTTMDLYTLKMEKYTGDDVNITAIHIIDTHSVKAMNISRQWAEYLGSNDTLIMKTEYALIYDAVSVIYSALGNLTIGQTINPESLTCGMEEVIWNQGLSLFNDIKKVKLDNGVTGRVAFHSNGIRKNPKLFVSELASFGLRQIAEWTLEKGLEFNRSIGEKNLTLINRTLIVTTVQETPYVMLRTSESGETLTGNDMYEGFCIDMLDLIAKKVGFTYKIKLVEDGDYGKKSDDGTWTGMVGELMYKKADIAVAPLTISFVREQVIDFSKPYMHLGITILYRVPEPQNPGVFSFLNPLSFDIWMYVVMAYLVVSITLFLLARFSPYEWYNEHPCNPDYDGVENQFNLLSCLWFAFGGLMQQGSEVNPRAFSTRVLSGFWWFFSLILVSSYTANLAAFLTVERMVSPIQNADDLAKQTTIEYGTRSGGSTETFFSRSKIPTYSKMWEYMDNKHSVFVETYKEGIQRVLNTKNYALLMESTVAEYTVSQHCKNLTQIGGLLNSRGYGIGTAQGDPIRDKITNAILQLQEEDEVLALKNKWWKTGQCTSEDGQKEDANELGLENIGGIFLVLIAGLVLGVLVAIAEFVWKSRQNAEIDRKSLCAEMMSELRFACRCNGKKKPVRTSLDHKYMPAPYPSGLNGQTIPMTETIA